MTTFNETITDDLDGSEDLAELLTGTDIISDPFEGGESSLITHWLGLRTFDEILGFQDTPKPGWKFLLDESFNLSETHVINWVVPLFDQLFTSDALKIQGNYNTFLNESISIEELITQWRVFNDIIAESYNFSEDLIDIHTKVGLLLDILRIKETVVNTGTFQNFLADTLNLLDALERIFKESLNEALDLSGVVKENGIFLTLVDENFTAQDVVAEIFTATVEVTDTFQGVDSNGVTGTYFALSNDSLIFRNEIILSGQIFACWVLTTKNYNPSIYSNFDFNSYARSSKKLYGARSDGIYLLEGETDSGKDIHTGLMFDFSNMDIPETKRLRSIHLGQRKNPLIVIDSYDFSFGQDEISIGSSDIGLLQGGAQSFTGNGELLSRAIFKLGVSSGATGDMFARIYAHAGVFGTSSEPTGPVLAEVIRDVSTLKPISAQEIFIFDPPFPTVNGVKYTISFEWPDPDMSYRAVNLSVDNSSPTHPGNLTFITGVNFYIPQATRDMVFELTTHEDLKARIQVSTDRAENKTYKVINDRVVVGKEVRGKFWTVAIEDVQNLKSMELNVILLSKKR